VSARVDPTGDVKGPAATASARSIVLGDIGGTTARFALLTGHKLSPVEHMNDVQFPHFSEALRRFLDRRQEQTTATAALFAVAGPVHGEYCALINKHWVIDGAELRRSFGFSNVRLINDFEAVAWSLPQLAANDRLAVGGGKAMSGTPILVVGPGTGLGIAAFIPDAEHPRVIATEGGHGTLPASSRREDAVIHILRRRFGHVSSERTLSGSGIENLYNALAELDGVSVPQRSAAEITQAALAGTCPVSREALDMFCAMLGTVAGNVALGFGARGGIYVGGGIVPRIADFFARSSFRERLEAKGRLGNYMQSIPSYVILHPDVAFLGLRTLAHRWSL
jgi:glucokinase